MSIAYSTYVDDISCFWSILFFNIFELLIIFKSDIRFIFSFFVLLDTDVLYLLIFFGRATGRSLFLRWFFYSGFRCWRFFLLYRSEKANRNLQYHEYNGTIPSLKSGQLKILSGAMRFHYKLTSFRILEISMLTGISGTSLSMWHHRKPALQQLRATEWWPILGL